MLVRSTFHGGNRTINCYLDEDEIGNLNSAGILTSGGRDLAQLPAIKTALAGRPGELGCDVETRCIEAGAGFSPGIGSSGAVWIISGGRREGLFREE